MSLSLSESQRAEVERIVNEISKLDKKSLMSYWIAAEIDEAETYSILADRVEECSWDERIPKLFRELAQESVGHAEALLREYKTLYPGEQLVTVKLPGLEQELSMDELEGYIRNGRFRDLIEVLMKTEKIAQEVYAHLAENSSGEERKMFEKLANIEKGHYQKLLNLAKSVVDMGE